MSSIASLENVKHAKVSEDGWADQIKNLHRAVYPPNGRVTVSAPEPMSLDAIRVAVVTRLAWVKRAQKQIALAPHQSPREMVDGESHYYLGQRYRIKVIEQTGTAAITISNKTHNGSDMFC